MYPARELTELARKKSVLREAIARRRIECMASAAEVAKPVEWIDRAQLLWRRAAPWLAPIFAPSGPSPAGRIFPALKVFSTLVRWTPSLFHAVKTFWRTCSSLSAKEPAKD